MKNVPLGDIATLVRGVSFSKEEGSLLPLEGHLPVIRAGSIQESLLLREGQIWVPADKIKSSQKIRIDDIVMCTSSGSSDLVGKCARSTEDFDGSFGAFCAGIRADQEKASPSYLYHFLCSPVFKNWTSASSGANIKNIRVSDLAEFQVPLPSLPEQKRIAAILDKADAIRRKRQQAIQLADDFLRAVFLDMFGDPVTNPKGWETFALADVVRKDSIITYGIVQAGEHLDGGVPYIRTGDFKDGKLMRSGYACTSADIASKFKRSEVAPGDIVYCIRASVGSADVVPAFLAGANLTQGTAKISPAHDMKAEFLVELLRSAGFRSWIDKNSKGATFKEITLARLREAPVFKPPMFEQEAFIRIKKIVMERLAGKFQEADVPLFESLSQKAFSGQL